MAYSGKTSRGRTYVRLTLEERFWPKVNKDGPVIRAELGPCWLWTGSILKTGYGCIRSDDGETITAHLAAWVVSGRARPSGGRELCHRCDNRPCVRLDHLFDGTRSDNMQDAAAKGRLVGQAHPERMSRGSRHGQSKLTETQVTEIRQLAASGLALAEIARRFDVSDTLIGYIVKRRWWRHVA